MKGLRSGGTKRAANSKLSLEQIRHEGHLCIQRQVDHLMSLMEKEI